MRINVLILLMYLSSLNCIAQFPIIYKSDSVYCTLFYGDKENQLVVFDNDKDTFYNSYFDTEVKIWKDRYSDIKRRVRKDNRLGWSVSDGKVYQFSIVSIDTTFRYACNPEHFSEKLWTSFVGLELKRLGETFPTRYRHKIPISFKCHESVVLDTSMTDSSYFNYWKDSAFVDIMNCGGYVLKVFQQVSSRGLQEYIEYGPNGYYWSCLNYIKSAKENGKYGIISVDSLWLVNGPYYRFYSFQNAYKIPYANHFKAFYIDNCNYILNDSLEVYKLDLSKNHILDSENFDNFYDGPKEKIKRKIIPAEKVGYFDLSSKEDYFFLIDSKEFYTTRGNVSSTLKFVPIKHKYKGLFTYIKKNNKIRERYKEIKQKYGLKANE